MTAVSYVITVFNKEEYLPEVIRSLEAQVDIDTREYIFVDDGSTDNSVQVIKDCTKDLDATTIIIEQENLGASWGTNAGVEAASHDWIKLCDGDDLLTPHSSTWLIDACEKLNVDHAWGHSAYFEWQGAEDPLTRAAPYPKMEVMEDGLKFFIRNNPANSTCMLFKKKFYQKVGGCDPRLVSPDQMLFLRLFANGPGARVFGDVGLLPDAAPDRLSAQKGRSRYESVLAMYFLIMEKPDLNAAYIDYAYKRAISRAERFHRKVYGGLFNRFLVSHVRTKLWPHASRIEAIRDCLAAFTPDGKIERPQDWKPGAGKTGKAGPDF
ncbi:glycosyltransferase family 2 protein [Terasakiella sp. A23]|uniref:glycosyltransferase family 2 protein n=1 Tax=Terasakiella sp. FCG-A23 TaxID=3080561 RepID=UPI00295396E2|nr:glycosyltransferase family 2 protein [Terasakiella sp. A23]MDV7339883.1 glycosyltransferase family 2 protein [Terasakiella sp. A23]